MIRRFLLPALLLTACTPPPSVVSVTPAAPRASASSPPPSVAPSALPLAPAARPASLPSVPPVGLQPRIYAPRASTVPAAATTTGSAESAAGTAPRAGASPDGPAPLYTGAWLLRTPTEPTLPPGFTERGRLTLGATLLLRLDPPAGLGDDAIRARLAPLGAPTPEARRHRQDFDFTKPDPFFRFQWAHRADRGATIVAWERVLPPDQTRVVVAVLDTGLDVTHPEFTNRIVDPANFTNGGAPNDVHDADGHGTHVAGIVGAAGDNDAGVAGVAWGVKIKPVKVLADDGGGDEFDILAGFLHAIRWRPQPDDGTRVRVVNMSLGSPTGAVSALWADAVAEARAAGVVVVAATGNAGAENVDAPANTPGVLAVGSSNDYLAWEDVSPFTNHGDRLDLVAPGEDIISTVPVLGTAIGASYAYLSGTSMASPYVAGVAALVMARYDRDNLKTDGVFAEAVHRRLLKACDDLGVPGRDPWFGEGRLNAKRAVTPVTIDDVP